VDDTGAAGADDGGSIPQGGFVPCFSRDKEKEYVSHGIRANSKNVWAFLRASDCKIVVCGSAGDMPEDVLESFVFVCQLEGGMDETQARMFLRKMDARGQYVVEAW
jgi:sulfite reductase (NADPH) flavoprotein alpha-component